GDYAERAYSKAKANQFVKAEEQKLLKDTVGKAMEDEILRRSGVDPELATPEQRSQVSGMYVDVKHVDAVIEALRLAGIDDPDAMRKVLPTLLTAKSNDGDLNEALNKISGLKMNASMSAEERSKVLALRNNVRRAVEQVTTDIQARAERPQEFQHQYEGALKSDPNVVRLGNLSNRAGAAERKANELGFTKQTIPGTRPPVNYFVKRTDDQGKPIPPQILIPKGATPETVKQITEYFVSSAEPKLAEGSTFTVITDHGKAADSAEKAEATTYQIKDGKIEKLTDSTTSITAEADVENTEAAAGESTAAPVTRSEEMAKYDAFFKDFADYQESIYTLQQISPRQADGSLNIEGLVKGEAKI
ncbi:hypothetical protein NO2_1703, partial [Candidatus Termititenax persephonae]